jgi:Tol biopolymer transport system component
MLPIARRGRSIAVMASIGIVCATTLVRVAPAVAASGPDVTVGDVSVVEGNSGTLTVKVPVDLSTAAASSVTVAYSVTSDSAPDSAGTGDFVAKHGKVTFLAGQVSKQISVKVNGDASPEPNEHVDVNVTPVTSNATVSDGSGTVGILDDDASGPPAAIQANVGDVTVTEADSGTHTAYLPITLSEPAPSKISLTYEIDCASALSGADFIARALGTLSFSAGQQSKAIPIKITADTTGEGLESIAESIKVKTASVPVTVNQSAGTTTINDNDPLPPGQVEMETVTPDGSPASYQPITDPLMLCLGYQEPAGYSSISGDGRYVAFESTATDLVAGGEPGATYVYLRDRYAGVTERIGLGSGPQISSNGRYVVFNSYASLAPEDTGAGQDVYLFDRTTGTLELVSVAMGGAGSDDSVGPGDVSDDGRYVVFQSTATNLVPNDIDPPPDPWTTSGKYPDVFLRDRVLGTTELVSTGGVGVVPDITPDGSKLVFQGNLTLNGWDGNGVYLRDIPTGTVTLVGLSDTGAPVLAEAPRISADGTKVVFNGEGTVVSSFPNPPVGQVYLRDLTAGTTELVDNDPSMTTEREPFTTAISADGRYVSYTCWCQRSDLSGMGHEGVYRYDRTLGVTEEIDVTADGVVADGDSVGGAMSDDGSILSFSSLGANLVPGDGNEHGDIFVKRLS